MRRLLEEDVVLCYHIYLLILDISLVLPDYDLSANVLELISLLPPIPPQEAIKAQVLLLLAKYQFNVSVLQLPISSNEPSSLFRAIEKYCRKEESDIVQLLIRSQNTTDKHHLEGNFQLLRKALDHCNTLMRTAVEWRLSQARARRWA